MPMLVERFAATLAPQEADLARLVADYAAWYAARQPAPPDPAAPPSDDDDVEIRTYLLDLRIDGGDREALGRRMLALQRFYAWAQAEGLITENPFDEYNFDRPLLTRDQIRRRPDVLGGDAAEREVGRLRALNHLAEQLNRSADIQSALDVTLETLLEVLGLQTGWVFLWTEAGLTPYLPARPAPHDFVLCAACGLPPGLEQDGQVHLIDPPDCHCQYLLRDGLLRRAVNVVECTRLQDSAEAEGDTRGLLYHASVPLISQGRPLGILNVATDDWQFLGAADLQLLSAAGAQLSITLERARLFARSAELGALEERMRLAREIHDTLAQGLTAITLNLETADALLESDGGPARPRQAVRQALDQAHASLEEARRSVLDLRAAPLEGRTLADALQALAAECTPGAAGPRVRFTFSGERRPLAARLEVGLYRIAQEALANALRHGQAGHVTLALELTAAEARLTVEDDGRGFDPAATPEGRYGLIGLNERARLLGGRLSLETGPGEGTRVEVVVLLNPQG
jgi:two-component system, NarL family, sensor kinase